MLSTQQDNREELSHDKNHDLPLDFVFVIGDDNSGETQHQEIYDAIKRDCEAKGLTYKIIGNGKSGVSESEIAKLPKANNVIVYAHGGVKDNSHNIMLANNPIIANTLQTMHALQAKTNAKNLFLCSCFGGKIIDDFQNSDQYKLQEGTFLSAYSAPDEVSWSNDAATIQKTIINATTPGKPAPVINITAEVIKTISQTMVFGYQQEEKLHSQALMRNSRQIYNQVEKFCDFQWENYNNFINRLLLSEHSFNLKEQLKNEFPEKDIDEYIHKIMNNENVKLLELNMSDEEKSKFQKKSIHKHVLHNDIEVITALLKTIPGVAEKIWGSVSGLPDKSKHIADSMVRVLLENGYQDLSKGNLSNRSLTQGNFRNINFSSYNLTGSDLSDANLTGANLMNTDLRSVKGLTADMLLGATSLLNTKIDAQHFKNMSYDEQALVKQKMVKDYKDFVDKSDSVNEIARFLKEFAADETHPLKYMRIGLWDYGNSASYTEVINYGVEKLLGFLNRSNNINEMNRNIDLLEEINLLKNIDKNLKDQLTSAINKIPKDTLVEAISKIEELPEHDKFIYAKNITNRIEYPDEILWIVELLSGKDRLEYAKYANDKIKTDDDRKSMQKLIPEQYKLEYEEFLNNKEKSIIREPLPAGATEQKNTKPPSTLNIYGALIGNAANLRQTLQDASKHAEMKHESAKNANSKADKVIKQPVNDEKFVTDDSQTGRKFGH